MLDMVRSIDFLVEERVTLSISAAEQHDDVDEEEADEDEREVDEELLQVPLGLRVHLDLGRPADRRLGHVLHPLHGVERQNGTLWGGHLS